MRCAPSCSAHGVREARGYLTCFPAAIRPQTGSPPSVQEGYGPTATGRQQDILGLLDEGWTGSMNDALRKDEFRWHTSRSFISPLVFHFMPRYIKHHTDINYISSPFPSLPRARGDTRTTYAPLRNTRYRIQNSTHVRGSLVCFYPVSIPVAPRAEFDFTWSWH